MTKFQEAINFDSDAIFLQSVNLMRPQIEHLAGETKAERKNFSDPGSFNLSQIFFQTRFIYEDIAYVAESLICSINQGENRFLMIRRS